MRKRVIAILLCISMIVLSACGSNAKDSSAADNGNSEVVAADAEESAEQNTSDKIWDEPEPGHYSFNGLDLGKFNFPKFVEITSEYGGYTGEEFFVIQSEGTVQVGKDADWLKKDYGYSLKKQSDNEYRLTVTRTKSENQKVKDIVNNDRDFLNSLAFMMSDESKADYYALLDVLKNVEDVDFYQAGTFNGEDPVVNLLWDCYGTNSFYKLTYTLDYAGEAETESGPWEVNDDGHIIADGIDLYYFPMDEFYKALEKHGEIDTGITVSMEGAYAFHYTDNDGLRYTFYLQDAGKSGGKEGFVLLNANVDNAYDVAAKNGGDVHAIADTYDTLFNEILPSVLDDEKTTILKTSWEEYKNADDLEYRPSFMFPFNDNEYWAMSIGTSVMMHLDCSKQQ